MEKINIAELLQCCPKGMELYSPLCGKCVFDRLNMGTTIVCKKQNTQEITFTREGYYMLPAYDDCECMLFPSKDQRDWSKFQRPFKVGDKIRQKNQHDVCLISEVCDGYYLLDEKDISLPFFAQDQWELVPNKFDIASLRPFDKVLVKYGNVTNWKVEFYSHYDNEGMPYSPFCCIGSWYEKCIPYEGNEHLLGTNEDCDEYYKTWK